MKKNQTITHHKEKANEKKDIERNFIRLLNAGNAYIAFSCDHGSSTAIDLAQYLSMECKLDRYTELNEWDLDSNYSTLNDESKRLYQVIKTLESFEARGWVSAKYYVIFLDNPDGPLTDVWESKHETDIDSVHWLAVALLPRASENQRTSCHGHPIQDNIYSRLSKLEYQLTALGFEYALSLENSEADQRRHDIQVKLNRRSVSISSVALIAGFFIAIGSFGGLLKDLEWWPFGASESCHENITQDYEEKS